jgi:hypothetical protein
VIVETYEGTVIFAEDIHSLREKLNNMFENNWEMIAALGDFKEGYTVFFRRLKMTGPYR